MTNSITVLVTGATGYIAKHCIIQLLEKGYRDENFSGYRWRVLSTFDDESNNWLLVAERTDIRIDLADDIILRALLPIILSLPFIAAIVWLVVRLSGGQKTHLATVRFQQRYEPLRGLPVIAEGIPQRKGRLPSPFPAGWQKHRLSRFLRKWFW